MLLFIYNDGKRFLACYADNADIAVEIIFQHYDGNISKDMIASFSQCVPSVANRIIYSAYNDDYNQ